MKRWKFNLKKNLFNRNVFAEEFVIFIHSEIGSKLDGKLSMQFTDNKLELTKPIVLQNLSLPSEEETIAQSGGNITSQV